MRNDGREVLLLKGNEAIAHAAIRYGFDGMFGYPITPQSEILETLAALKPWETTGMVVLQSESEVASINMVYGGGATGKCVMTSSSSVGIALMQEGISYMAACEIPGLIVSVQRGGPGLGTIQPSQSDYFQAVYGGGNGDYNTIVLAPYSVQEMADMVGLAKDLMMKWRNPVIILSDGAIGQMMEKCVLPPLNRDVRLSDKEIEQCYPWAINGLGLKNRQRRYVSSVELDANVMYMRNKKLQEKYRSIIDQEVRYEKYLLDDAEVVVVAFGTSARIAMSAINRLREEYGKKVGMLRPITLWPFPDNVIHELAGRVRCILTVELNEGQMVRDVRLAVEGQCKMEFLGTSGGVMLTPDDVFASISRLVP